MAAKRAETQERPKVRTSPDLSPFARALRVYEGTARVPRFPAQKALKLVIERSRSNVVWGQYGATLHVQIDFHIEQGLDGE